MSTSTRPSPNLSGFHVMTKPVGPICNLDCRYCFYLEKEELYRPGLRGAAGEPGSWRMADDLLESYIRQYIAAQGGPEIHFAWQGGEPTLLGVEFFRRVVALQQQHSQGRRIHNALQTNGVLLDDAWCEFLARERFLVGLSIDGPQELHDAYRVDKQGRPTFDAVIRGLDRLKRQGVEFNTLTVVHRRNSQEPLAVYRFLKEIGSGFLQLIPLVERSVPPTPVTAELIQLTFASPPGPAPGADEPQVTEWSVRPDDYGRFLVAIFDEWVRKDVGKVFVQHFDVALGIWSGMGAGLCVFAEQCGAALALEHNGDLYACDHYVYPEFRLGNLRDHPLTELARSAAQRKFGADKADTLPDYCRRCDVRFACNGECPKHRFTRTPDGEWGLNYLCAAYQRFFRHVDPYMRTMAHLLEQRRPPAEIMWMAAELDQRNAERHAQALRTARRNDPCPCGSGRKFKRCCFQEGRRERGEGRSEKGEGRREKGEVRGEKGEVRSERGEVRSEK